MREAFSAALHIELESAKKGSAGSFGANWRTLQNKSCTRLRIARFAENNKAAPRAVCCLAKSKPGCEGNPTAVLRCSVCQVQHNGRKSTCLQKQVSCAQCLVEPRPGFSFPLAIHTATPHPQKMLQCHAIRRSRFWIEGIGDIHPGTHLVCSAPRYKSQSQACAPRRLWSCDLADGSNGQTAVQQCIHFCDSCWSNFADCPSYRRKRSRKASFDGAFDLEAKSG
jgi:hypothetical protein